jgi:glycosyltransferase involved in cell wall biosynthesis
LHAAFYGLESESFHVMTGVNWIVTQIGSRERYAVPRAFHARGHLQHFYTDIWSGRAAAWARFLPRGDGFAHRFHPDLPADRVTGFNAFGIGVIARGILRKARTMDEEYGEFTRIGKEFALRVNRDLEKRTIDPKTAAGFLFTTGALETCQYLKKLGVPVIVDQLDPARVDQEMIEAEIERWPGWEEYPGKVPDSYFDRLAEEWRLSDLVLVNSNWSRSAMLKQGVDDGKIIVVPLCFEKGSLPTAPARVERSTAKPLMVLWIGQIVLRKGIQYLFEAAAKLINANVRFVVAGRVGISAKGLMAAPSNVTVRGYITHGESARLYSEADVFVLPTISDGFALTQLEAMSFGLPVITTPNCGDVVTHGEDGLIVPPRDSHALADAIASLERNRPLVRDMSQKAMATAAHPRFSLDGYAEAVENALTKIRGPVQTA